MHTFHHLGTCLLYTSLIGCILVSVLLVIIESLKSIPSYLTTPFAVSYTHLESNNDLLLRLINDILDLSKIESGILERKREKFNLAILQIFSLRIHSGNI